MEWGRGDLRMYCGFWWRWSGVATISSSILLVILLPTLANLRSPSVDVVVIIDTVIHNKRSSGHPRPGPNIYASGYYSSPAPTELNYLAKISSS